MNPAYGTEVVIRNSCRQGQWWARGSLEHTGSLQKLPRCNQETLQVLFAPEGEKEKGQVEQCPHSSVEWN